MATVDTSIYARTTGSAAALAAEHSAEKPLKLYGGWFCPFVQRAWMVLVEKSIPHQYVEINPYHKAPEFLALNPRGLVPTLAVPVNSAGGSQKPLYESSIVCEYLDEAYRSADGYGPDLLPEDPYERSRARLWMDHVGGKIVPAFYKMLQHTPEKPYSVAQAREELHRHLKTFAAEMAPAEEGPWFLGERFSLVDVMLAPWAKRFFLIDHYKAGGVRVPVHPDRGEDEAVWARWEVWFEAAIERESAKRTWSEEEKYIEVYKRYAEDTTQSEVGQATRSGASLP